MPDLQKPSFGSIETRNHRTATTYRAVWRLNGEKQTKTFDTYSEAYDLLEEMAIEIRRGGKARNTTKPRTPWGEVAWAWYALRHPRDEAVTRGRDYYAIRKFEAPHGTTPIGSITRQDVQRWINALCADPAEGCGDCEDEQIEAGDDEARCATHKKAKPMSPKTVGDYYQVVGQIMREAQLDGHLPNGCPIGKGLHKLPTVQGRMTFLTDDQADHLLAVCLERYPTHYALVHLVAHTGLRQGEALGLTRNRYNPLGKHLMVQQSLKKRTRKLGTTKTNRHRRIDLMPCCVEVLNVHLAAHEFDFVFPAPGGGPLSADNWRNRVWVPLVEAAGFTDLNLHFHDLRHSHCTSILAAGWDVTIVAERMGHASTKMTLDRYGHAIEGRQKTLLERHGIRAI